MSRLGRILGGEGVALVIFGYYEWETEIGAGTEGNWAPEWGKKRKKE
jgi:hypothetical protein